MPADPLADVIHKAIFAERGAVLSEDDIVAAVRAHIAAVLDAAYEDWYLTDSPAGVPLFVGRLRATLVGTEEAT